jgi:hypothetical protein
MDRFGRPIRDDVRSAGHQIWNEACRRTEAVLSDRTQAASLMEESVAQVSRYLDRVAAPRSSAKNGLLLLAFSRALRRFAAKSSRLQFAGGVADLCNVVIDHSWGRHTDARLDLEIVVRMLSDRNATILALRRLGYSWEEVAQILDTSVAGARNGFWREVKEVRRRLHSTLGPANARSHAEQSVV